MACYILEEAWTLSSNSAANIRTALFAIAVDTKCAKTARRGPTIGGLCMACTIGYGACLATAIFNGGRL